MSRVFLFISCLFSLINICNSARENTGYNMGVVNKNITDNDELFHKGKYKQTIELLKKKNKK